MIRLCATLCLCVWLTGCCAPAPQHVVVPGPNGQARVLHAEPGLITRPHGCDSHSDLNWNYLPAPVPAAAPQP